MKQIKLFSLLVFMFLVIKGNSQENIVETDDVYSGNTEVVAQQQVFLKPGFHAVSGSDVRVYIGTYPVIDFTDPVVSEVNAFNTSENTGQNYIHTIALLEKTTDENTLDDELRIETIAYFDGLGRPIQNVTVQGSPDRKDIVQPFIYDNFGNEVKKYLPYMTSTDEGSFISDATSASEAYYDTDKAWRDDDTFPFDSIHYESSPLNRVLGVTGSGSNWQGHSSTITYSTNSNPVEGWTVTGSSLTSGFSYNDIMYAANQLYITEVIDEDEHKTREYKDKLGQVVRKETWDGTNWQRTAYVYNDFGLLRAVVPPLATDITQTGLCYYYLYDGRKRMIEKQIPGSGPVYMVYDKRDRLTMTKDAENDWMVTLYDAFNRPVITGIIENITDSRATIQTAFNNFTGILYEEWNGDVDYEGYTSLSIPAAYTLDATEINTVTWYDNYSFFSLNTYFSNFNFITDDITGMAAKDENMIRGQITGSYVKLLADYGDISKDEQISVNYYDEYGNAIQVISDNHLGGFDISSTTYNFTGQPLVNKLTHNISGGSPVELLTTYKYDHQGRLLTEKFKLNNDTEFTLAANEYGDLGELSSKYLHGTAAAEKFNQKVDYKYNIKGWLTGINDVTDIDKNLFALALQYGDGTNGFYNGNIWKMDWLNKDYDPKRYTFDYDWANRLETANYADGTGFNNNTDAFLSEYTYDVNGNITNLQRNYADNLIDNLNYTYIAGSNKLESVDDIASLAYKEEGYKEGIIDYNYDLNGNMTEDHNGVDFSYNFLNLPQSIVNIDQNNTIGYSYSATGAKLQKKVVSGTTADKIVDYIGPFLYEDDDLKVIFTSAGRIVKNVDENNIIWKYEYNLTDHLGNVRAVFAAHDNGIPELMQHTEYYPFGMVMNQQQMFALEEVENKYLYNGKELQNDDIGITLDWYDYGARFYDPALGRFHAVDPLAEDYDSWTPYHYVHNNPILLIDPTGMGADWFQNEETGNMYYNSSMTKGDEGTGAMKGEGWKHMGENGMFGTDDNTVIEENRGLATGFKTTGAEFTTEASFNGENAKSFMKGQGFEFKPTQQIQYEANTWLNIPLQGRPSLTINFGNDVYITEKSSYISVGAVETSSIPISRTLAGRDGLFLETVNRFQINYSNSRTSVGISKFNSNMEKGLGNRNAKGRTIYNSSMRYPGNIKLINEFMEGRIR